MDTRLTFQTIIKRILNEYAYFKPVHGNISCRVSFDDEHGAYALFQVGWDGDTYVHGAVIHIDLLGDQVWIQYDGTEDGVAGELVDAGIPKEQIILGFRPPELRPYTGFGVGKQAINQERHEREPLRKAA